jgi:hypothetical protein
MNTPEAAGERRPLALLERTAGARAGEPLAVPHPVVTVGRAPSCEVVIDDDSVSDRHARLAYEGGGWTITDLGSINGTAVEGARLQPETAVPLPYGAALRVGGVKLRFGEVAGADPDTASASWTAPEAPRTLREERTGARFPLWLVFLLLVVAAAIAIIAYTLVVPAPTPLPQSMGPEPGSIGWVTVAPPRP